MYRADEVLRHLDHNLGVVLLFTAIAWVTGFVQIFEAVRLGLRDRLPGAPVGMSVFLLAHDSSFFARHDHWFHRIGHWYFELFWYGMGLSELVEIFMLVQFVRFGRDRVALRLSARAFVGLLLLFQATACVLLWWLQSMIDDPLYLVSLVGTQVAAVIFNLPMLMMRGNARGQSRWFAWATLLGPGSLALGLFPALAPSVFMTPMYAALCGLMAALSLTYLLLLQRYQRIDAVARSL